MRKKKSKSSPESDALVLNWQAQAQHLAFVNGATSKLGVTVAYAGVADWTVMALEVPLVTTTIEDVFSEHAHKIVGHYLTPSEAFAAAEGFARAWLKKFKAASFGSNCECDEIPTRSDDDVQDDVSLGMAGGA